MQISAISSALLNVRSTFVSIQPKTTSTAQQSEQKSDVLILSSTQLNQAVLYTGNGTPAPLLQDSADSTSPVSPVTAESSETDSVLVAEALAQYQDLVAHWVEHLFSGIFGGTNDTTDILGIDETSASVQSDFYSAEQTASRIVDFALSFYDGGDKAAYAEKMKEAVSRGFEQALTASGGSLPQISYDTINLALDALDSWAGGTAE